MTGPWFLARLTREALERVDAAQAHVERGMPELFDRAHEALGQLALAALLAPRLRRGVQAYIAPDPPTASALARAKRAR
jgi:hypothetical protein